MDNTVAKAIKALQSDVKVGGAIRYRKSNKVVSKVANIGVKRKVKSLSKWKHELDAIVSKYVRRKYSKGGICTCYTCGKRMTIQTSQNGHFVARSYLATRFDEDNMRPQCAGCNLFGNGKPLDFEEHLREEIGDERVDALKQRRHQIVKLTPAWYESEIERYRELLRGLE